MMLAMRKLRLALTIACLLLAMVLAVGSVWLNDRGGGFAVGDANGGYIALIWKRGLMLISSELPVKAGWVRTDRLSSGRRAPEFDDSTFLGRRGFRIVSNTLPPGTTIVTE